MAKIERVERGLYRVENKNESISWMIDYLNPDKKRIRKTFTTKKEAVQERAARVHLMAKGEYSSFVEKKKKQTATFGDLVEKYKDNYQDQISYKTGKKFYVEDILSYFGGDTLLVSIEYGDIKTYRTTLTRSFNQHGNLLSDSSVNSKMSCLRHMFNEAIQYKMIERNPFADGKTLMLKVDNERKRYLASEEILRLLDSSPIYLQHIIKCALLTGMRASNVFNLKWTQIRDGSIYVKTKTGKNNFPVSEALAKVFDQIKESRKGVKNNMLDLKGKPVKKRGVESEYVFTYKGKPVKSVKTALRRAVEDAGMVYGMKDPNGVTFHTLRHTYGTHLAQQNTHMRTIQELMGHSSLKMTERYTKVADDSKRKAVNGLDW